MIQGCIPQATNARRCDEPVAGGHFVLGFQSTLCASAGSILIGLLGRKDSAMLIGLCY